MTSLVLTLSFLRPLSLILGVLALFCLTIVPLRAQNVVEAQSIMRFALVESNAPGCSPKCEQWIAAQGDIDEQAAARLRKFLDRLKDAKDTKIPVFIFSRGGAAKAAVEMGELIRKRGMAVGVAQTRLEEPLRSKDGVEETGPLKPIKGAAMARALCASACIFVLAGGVQRYVSPQAKIGVHMLRTEARQGQVMRQYKVRYREENGSKIEVSRELIAEKESWGATAVAKANPETAVEYEKYLTGMGMTSELWRAFASTDFRSVRWLTPEEIDKTHLATKWFSGIAASLSNTAPRLQAVDPLSELKRLRTEQDDGRVVVRQPNLLAPSVPKNP